MFPSEQLKILDWPTSTATLQGDSGVRRSSSKVEGERLAQRKTNASMLPEIPVSERWPGEDLRARTPSTARGNHRERGERMSERKAYHVTPHPNGGWKVEAEGATQASSTHQTKEEAVDQTCSQGLRNMAGATLGEIHEAVYPFRTYSDHNM